MTGVQTCALPICGMSGPSDTCNDYLTFGSSSYLLTSGTYTYAYMEASDNWGAETGPIHQDNPFNIPDLTYTGAATPPTITAASVTPSSGGLGVTAHAQMSAEDDLRLGWVKIGRKTSGGERV